MIETVGVRNDVKLYEKTSKTSGVKSMRNRDVPKVRFPIVILENVYKQQTSENNYVYNCVVKNSKKYISHVELYLNIYVYVYILNY